LMERWGNLADISQQGLEAAHRVHKHISRRATNHSNKTSIHQQFHHIYRQRLNKQELSEKYIEEFIQTVNNS